MGPAGPRPRPVLGVGGQRLAPNAGAKYTVIEIKRSGFSQGYTVSEERPPHWSVKFPPEAATESSPSRIHWGIGYHQPPIYYVEEWAAEKAITPNPQLPARFREAKPDFHGLKADGTWSYYHNPFVGTPQLQGLLVLQAMLGNSDLKDDNNACTARRSRSRARSNGTWRATWGTPSAGPACSRRRAATSTFSSRRRSSPASSTAGSSSIGAAATTRCSPTSSRPTSAGSAPRLQTLTDAQWRDAFRAGGFDQETTHPVHPRLKQKIAQGLALEG